MAEWRSDEPPVDRDVEFEIDGRERRKGRLQWGGRGGVGKPGKVQGRLKLLFMVADENDKLFEVTRWREIDDEE